jgi:hypothetical protein
MKKLLFSLSVVAALAVGLFSQTGCKTVQTVTTDPFGTIVTNEVVVFDSVAAQATVSSMAELGVYMAVMQDTNTIPYFKLAVTALNSLIVEGQFDPGAIEARLKALEVEGLQNPYAMLGVRGALIFYKNAFSTVVAHKLDQTAVLKPILIALSTGISSGMSGQNVQIKYNLPPRK